MSDLKPPRPFWLRLLIILGVNSLVVVLIALVLGDFNILSNLYFISSAVFLVIAVVPAFSELGSNIRLAGRAISQGQKLAPLLKAREAQYQHGAQQTYLYSAAAIITFLLSLVIL
ncbi:MAG: hypothetical protein AB1345_00700 [Chloroflexota bacterium]